MSLKTITSRENPDYLEILALAGDRKARRQTGRTVLDGPHLLEAALAADMGIVKLVFSESAVVGPLGGWS